MTKNTIINIELTWKLTKWAHKNYIIFQIFILTYLNEYLNFNSYMYINT